MNAIDAVQRCFADENFRANVYASLEKSVASVDPENPLATATDFGFGAYVAPDSVTVTEVIDVRPRLIIDQEDKTDTFAMFGDADTQAARYLRAYGCPPDAFEKGFERALQQATGREPEKREPIGPAFSDDGAFVVANWTRYPQDIVWFECSEQPVLGSAFSGIPSILDYMMLNRLKQENPNAVLVVGSVNSDEAKYAEITILEQLVDPIDDPEAIRVWGEVTSEHMLLGNRNITENQIYRTTRASMDLKTGQLELLTE